MFYRVGKTMWLLTGFNKWCSVAEVHDCCGCEHITGSIYSGPIGISVGTTDPCVTEYRAACSNKVNSFKWPLGSRSAQHMAAPYMASRCLPDTVQREAATLNVKCCTPWRRSVDGSPQPTVQRPWLTSVQKHKSVHISFQNKPGKLLLRGTSLETHTVQHTAARLFPKAEETKKKQSLKLNTTPLSIHSSFFSFCGLHTLSNTEAKGKKNKYLL